MVNVCPDCGQDNEQSAVRCEKCGCPLEVAVCPDCNKVNEKDALRCTKCGCPLKKEEKSEKKIVISIKLVAVVLAVIIAASAAIAGITRSNNSFKEELIAGSMWIDTETGVKVAFREDGFLSLMNINVTSFLDAEMESFFAISEYKVVFKDKIKVGDEIIKVRLDKTGKITFEPSIVPIVKKVANEKEKGENK